MIYKIYFADNGVAKTGLTPTFSSFKKVSDGSNVTPPAISEVGGGWYKTADYTAPEDIVGVVDGGAALTADADRYVPFDATADDNGLEQTLDALLGKAVLDYSADTLTLYKRDGITSLVVMDMTESSATAKSYTTRTPQ